MLHQVDCLNLVIDAIIILTDSIEASQRLRGLIFYEAE